MCVTIRLAACFYRTLRRIDELRDVLMIKFGEKERHGKTILSGKVNNKCLPPILFDKSISIDVSSL